jgi:hypothetical protein
VTTPGVLGYQVQAEGYNNHDGYLRVESSSFGTSYTEYITVNSESAPVGSLYVTSTPNQAAIYVDGTFCGGTNGIVPDLLAGTHTVEVRKESYNPVSRTVTVYANQQTNVYFDLTAQTGTIAVTSSPPEAAVYLDNAYQGTTSASSGLLTLPTIPVGSHWVDVLKGGYAPFTATVTVANAQTAQVTATLNNDDLDEDGLPDGFENGYRDGFGNWHAPDSSLIDTDGDGLSDGYEAGEMVVDADGKTYFKQRSDPTKVDTDDDGLDDYEEDYLRTDPFHDDTDGDGLLDGEDDEPLIPADPIGDIIVERLRQEVALRLGALFGETGLEGEEFDYLVGDWAAHPYYALGWISSGIAVYGDVRDFLYAVSESDTVGAAINGIGLVPYLGDCEKTAADVAKYLLKYPHRVLDVAKVLVDQHVIQLLPDEGQLNVIDHFYLFATGRRVGTELKVEYTLTEPQIQKVIERKVELDKVVTVIKAGEDAIPLTEAREGHYVARHVTGTEGINDPTSFFPTTERVIRNGEPNPGTSSMTPEAMQAQIVEWIKEGLPRDPTGWSKQKKIVTLDLEPEVAGVGRIQIVVQGDTGVHTVIPIHGSQVYKYANGQWYPTR